MANSTTSRLVAKRWTKALIELALENKDTDKEIILKDIKEAASTIESSEELKNILNNPAVSVEEKQILLCKIFDGKINPTVYNFLFVLNLRKRLSVINEIADEFEKELENIKNIVRINITSAIDLNKEKQEEIKTKLSEKLQKDVVINWNTDNSIIAGLIFDINDTVIDNSIKHKLEDLRKRIMR